MTGTSTGILKPSSILKYQQEVGELHLSGGNMSYAQLYDNGLVFVLSRTSCKFIGRLRWRNVFP